ncbi:MAG: T9SS type A sorting domain-containing protein, partial [Tannerellaceae bacterium]|nr:T9SS type A sorting domain-containing protein [Tannerellaceae bacterium]
TGSGTRVYKYFVREDGCLSEVVYPEGAVIVREVYEYIGFNDPPNEVSPIPLPASNEWALSVVEGGLRLSLTAPTDVEVFQPTGRQILSRRLNGDTILPLPSGVYLVRIGGQTTRRIVIR